MNKKYKSLILNNLRDYNVKNLRTELFDGTRRIVFEITTPDKLEKTCAINYYKSVAKNSYSKNLADFIENRFIQEFLRLQEDGTLVSEYQSDDDEEDFMEECENCGEMDNECVCESLDSVARGLGLYIDDDGHWCPMEYDPFDGLNDWSEDLEPLESYRVLNDNSIQFIDEYSTFLILYKDEELEIEYLKKESIN